MKHSKTLEKYEAHKAFELVQPLAFGADGVDSVGPGDGDNDVQLPEVP